jgi:hypothetical protein
MNARKKYDDALYRVRNDYGGHPSAETIATAFEALRELLTPIEIESSSSVVADYRTNPHDPARIARDCLHVVRSPGVQPIGSPGSVIREAWDLGKEFEHRALASQSVSTTTYQAVVEQANALDNLLREAVAMRDAAYSALDVRNEQAAQAFRDLESARRERDEVRADNEKLKSALDRITKAMSETP